MEYYMNNKLIDLITELTIIANKLDQKGHTKKADELDGKIVKISAMLSNDVLSKYKNFKASGKEDSILGENITSQMESNSSAYLKDLDQKFINTVLSYAEAGDNEAGEYLKMIINNEETDVAFEKQMNPESTEVDARKRQLNKYLLNESDVIKRQGDPYEYVYDIYSDSFIIIKAPKDRQKAVGAKLGKDNKAYETLAEDIYNIKGEEYLKSLVKKTKRDFLKSNTFLNREGDLMARHSISTEDIIG